MIASLDDGASSDVERRDLGAHLAGCEACRREQEKTRRLALALAELAPEVAVPPALEGEVLRRVRRLDADPAWTERLRAWLSAPALAVGAAAVVMLLVVEAGHRDPARDAIAPVARPRVIETPPTGVATATAHPEDSMPARPGRDATSSRLASAADDAPPSEPPAELAASLPLLLDLPILRNMEKLEHFESIEALTSIDDAKTDESGTNG